MNKIIAEINKLTTWLQKHQNEMLPDSSKSKLFQCIEIYYRKIHPSAVDAVVDMLNCFLQLPEGRLVTAKDKKKALQWVQSLSNLNQKHESGFNEVIKEKLSLWLVQEVEDSNDKQGKQSVTLLSYNDDELWKEDIVIKDPVLFQQVVNLMSNGEANVVVELNEDTNEVVRLISSPS